MNDVKTVRYYDGYRWVAAIIKRGTKHLHLVHIDDTGVVVSKEPLVTELFLRPLLRKGKPYELRRAVRKFRAFGRKRGMTQAAKKILIEAESFGRDSRPTNGR